MPNVLGILTLIVLAVIVLLVLSRVIRAMLESPSGFLALVFLGIVLFLVFAGISDALKSAVARQALEHHGITIVAAMPSGDVVVRKDGCTATYSTRWPYWLVPGSGRLPYGTCPVNLDDQFVK